MDIREQIKELQSSLVSEIIEVCSIDSSYDETTADESLMRPFGQGCRDALDWMLEKGRKDGFEVHDVDGYAGDIIIGKGEEGLSILGHLDVIPAPKDGWDSDPFAPEVREGKLYGRGVSDDKGPLLAAYEAAKLYMRNNPDAEKHIRIIFGCNEERGSSCVAHYFTKMAPCVQAFTPDAEFPVIYGEKAHAGAVLTSYFASDKLISLEGGTVSNAVPASCTAVLKGMDFSYIYAAQAFSAKHPDIPHTIKTEGNNTVVTVFGKAAHASLPHLGLNAVVGMAYYLSEFMPVPQIMFIAEKLDKYYGEDLGIAFEGELGKLTMNLGLISYKDNKLEVTLDFRVPHEIDCEKLFGMVIKPMAGAHGYETEYRFGKALIADKEGKLVKALDAAYREVEPMGDGPQAIGGGTYAKEANNCVGFGPAFPGEVTHIHEPNEVMDLASLEKATLIYYKAIEKLME